VTSTRTSTFRSSPESSLAAVGDELVITHPRTDLHTAGSLVTLGEPALYLTGLMACAARIGHAQRPTRVAVTILLLALIPLGARTPGLVVAAIVTALLGFLVLAEQPRPAEISARA